jgi:hypothetical protein
MSLRRQPSFYPDFINANAKGPVAGPFPGQRFIADHQSAGPCGDKGDAQIQSTSSIPKRARHFAAVKRLMVETKRVLT